MLDEPCDDISAWPTGDIREAGHRAGHAHALEELRRGRHPDAIRFGLHHVEELAGPLGPDVWAGVEDALAGLPC